MLLPAINLVNLNVSRILERASEIGVRKAFGASSRPWSASSCSRTSCSRSIGGVLGFVLAALVLCARSTTSGLIPYAALRAELPHLPLGPRLSPLVFGVLSGV